MLTRFALSLFVAWLRLIIKLDEWFDLDHHGRIFP